MTCSIAGELLVAQLRPAKRLFSDPPQLVGHRVHDRKRYPGPSWRKPTGSAMSSLSQAFEKDDVPTEGGYDAARCGASDGFDVAGQVYPIDGKSRSEVPDPHRVVPAAGDGGRAVAELGAGNGGDR